jgi:hypothetical protein
MSAPLSGDTAAFMSLVRKTQDSPLPAAATAAAAENAQAPEVAAAQPALAPAPVPSPAPVLVLRPPPTNSASPAPTSPTQTTTNAPSSPSASTSPVSANLNPAIETASVIADAQTDKEAHGDKDKVCTITQAGAGRTFLASHDLTSRPTITDTRRAHTRTLRPRTR